MNYAPANSSRYHDAVPILKPFPLKAGAHLAILSPASTPINEKVQSGIAALGSLGYRTTLYPYALTKGPLYFAGTAEQRLADLHAAFADPTIDAILCTRGGWGSAVLLPHLNLDLIRANPQTLPRLLRSHQPPHLPPRNPRPHHLLRPHGRL